MTYFSSQSGFSYQMVFCWSLKGWWFSLPCSKQGCDKLQGWGKEDDKNRVQEERAEESIHASCNDMEGIDGMKPRYSRDCLMGRFLKVQNDPKDFYWAINICILFVLWKINLWSFWWWDINILPSFEWIFFKRKRMFWCKKM